MVGPDTVITDDEPIVIQAMTYISELGRILEQKERRIIQNYLVWRTVFSLVTYSIGHYQKEHFEFQQVLSGIKMERNRSSQCVDMANKNLEMAVGELFVRDNFNTENKVTRAALKLSLNFCLT